MGTCTRVGSSRSGEEEERCVGCGGALLGKRKVREPSRLASRWHSHEPCVGLQWEGREFHRVQQTESWLGPYTLWGRAVRTSFGTGWPVSTSIMVVGKQ